MPRLYDLIRIEDERVKTAFYFALRDTLVANNLEQASRIAYGAQRYRVVSLGGDMIETTGEEFCFVRFVAEKFILFKLFVMEYDRSCLKFSIL